jgi:competence protein CoiA
MLCAKRKSDGRVVSAYLERKSNGPFACPECGEEVILKTSRLRVNYFAHANPIACRNQEGESEAHRRCKMEIFEALRQTPGVRNVALERRFELGRADVSAVINGVSVAIEVQISALSVETIMRRTIEYARDGIYVLWLLPWTPKLDAERYAPTIWEKWLHAAYFGRVYYWTSGLSVVSYTFEPSYRVVPRKTWYSKRGKQMTAGGYARRSERYRTPVRGETLNIAKDFIPQERFWWEGGGIKVPDAKLFMQQNN